MFVVYHQNSILTVPPHGFLQSKSGVWYAESWFRDIVDMFSNLFAVFSFHVEQVQGLTQCWDDE